MVVSLFSSLGFIARAYAAADHSSDGYVMRDWGALSKAVHKQFAAVEVEHGIVVVDDPEPYETVWHMQHALDSEEPIKVSRANSNHPLWSVETNVAFRTAHDVYGHYHAITEWGATADFSWDGELQACAKHALTLNEAARRALFVECIAQTGAAIYFGGFQPQKCISNFVTALEPPVSTAYLRFIKNPMTALVR